MGDKEAQVNRRSEYVQGVERNTVQKIQVLHDHILVYGFKMAQGAAVAQWLRYPTMAGMSCVRSQYH
ncbi:hypothetical protein TNCV_2319451 [Trichonephila clavipes]|nr:hypothetical protein TNCV_2319451 [Trichonephila clavipes]